MPHHFNFYDHETAEKAKDDTFASSAKYHNAHKSFLSPLVPVKNVIVQDPKTNLWDKKGVIISVRPDKLSYNVECEGREFLRSRKMLRPVPNQGPNVTHPYSHRREQPLRAGDNNHSLSLLQPTNSDELVEREKSR